MKLIAKIFLEKGEDYPLGPGRADLLRSVMRLGSLRQASLEMGMSYRWAWGKLHEAEEGLGIPLMVRTKKSLSGRPNVLTEEALAVLEWYDAVEAEVNELLERVEKNMPDCLKKGP